MSGNDDVKALREALEAAAQGSTSWWDALDETEVIGRLITLGRIQRILDRLEEAERDAERRQAALDRIVKAYDAYRGRGVAPAPGEYGALVEAIHKGRAALQNMKS